MKVDDAIDRFNTARKRLKHGQGRVARRNARRAYLDALRSIRKALDDEFPIIRKPIINRKKPNPKRAVRNKDTISQQMHRQLLAAGVNPSQFIERGKAGDTAHKIYAPRWMARAFRAGIGTDLIARAVRSQRVRRNINTIVRLKG